MTADPTPYPRLRRALGDRALPAALVDLDAFERNVDRAVALAREGGRALRVATKSVRSVELLRAVARRAGEAFAGVMAYSAHEAERLAGAGFDDVLVAYPVARRAEADALARAVGSGATVSVVADDAAQLDALSAAAVAAGVTAPVLVDLDVSLKLAGGGVHVGVRRSPLRTARDAVGFAREVARRPGLRFHGVMAYEAQVAGLADDTPSAPWRGAAHRWIKGRSRPEVERTRREVAEALRAEGLGPAVFNGGGTGSLAWCAREPWLTEVTAGSAFLGGALFDGYRSIRPEPALAFALPVVRRPAEGVVTCFAGGYVASGAAGADRLPSPWLPEGLALLGAEGAGEVQTPLRVPRGVALAVGDPVFFRHGKPGELAERFDRYLLVRGDRVEAEATTYRGEGWCFG